jgi:phospholipase/lecithinase/hemolysin
MTDRRIVTADGVTKTEGDRVFDYYDGAWGTISRIDSAGWFDLILDNGKRGGFLNGERVCHRIPRSNPFYSEFSSGNPV